MAKKSDAITVLLVFFISSCVMLIVWLYRVPIATRLFNLDTPVHSNGQTVDKAPAGYGDELKIRADGSGHYFLDAEVDRTTVNFLVDTGASITIISNRDARRLGLDHIRNAPEVVVQTGSGKLNMPRVSLPYVEAGRIRIDHVDALIAPENAMDQSVLGMNFLNRLKSYHVQDRTMTLVP